MGLKGKPVILGTKGAPGPGAYSMRSSLINIPGSKIGTSNRNDEIKNIMRVGSPGPSAYRISSTMSHYPVKQDAPNYRFGTSSRDKLATAGSVCSPGPGAYNYKNIIGSEGSKRSMLGTRPTSAPASRNSPGPGAYSASYD